MNAPTPPTMNAPKGLSRMAAVQMMTSLRYMCPPGTGTPKELSTMLKAMRIAVTAMTFICLDFIFITLDF